MQLRAREEEGFGLIELVIAMVVLNVGILALVATFQSGALAVSRSAATSNGAAVADKTMEVFRALQNKAIYLNAPAGGGADVSGYPNGIPNSTSTWYSKYQADTAAYGSVTYYNYSTPASSPLWVTQATTGSGYTPIPTSSSANLPSGLSPDPTKAVQLGDGPRRPVVPGLHLHHHGAAERDVDRLRQAGHDRRAGSEELRERPRARELVVRSERRTVGRRRRLQPA